ncbi:MAG: PEP-CTERM sorting domain-containing protein [Phycisphaerae bacterium]|nr:PEP-CTERM sorting domain-containing protein [Phycisphaerae bacterium]
MCAHIVRWSVALAVLGLVSTTALGTDPTEWSVTSGNWSTPTNWSTGEPTVSASARINNGGTATIDQMGEICLELRMGQNISDLGFVHMTGGRLESDYEFIGYYSQGSGSTMTTVTQDDGVHVVGWGLFMAEMPLSRSTYSLNGGRLTANRNTQIGVGGTAWFNQTGGTHEVFGTDFGTDFLMMGKEASGSGTYNLSGTGHLTSTLQEYVGYEGAGYFRQFGANTIHEAKILNIGGKVGSNGSGRYDLEAGTLAMSQTLAIGGADGQFVQTGGAITDTVQTTVTVAGTGRYELQNGSVNVHELRVFGNAASAPGRGVFEQTGGSMNLDTVYLRGGDCDLAGGTFDADMLVVGEDMLYDYPDLRVLGDDASILVGSYTQQDKGSLYSIFDVDGISAILVGSTADLDGQWYVQDPSGTAPFGRFNIIQAGSPIVGSFDAVHLPGPDWSWGITNDRTLWVEHVPEPSSLLLLAVGGAAFRYRRLRGRRVS